MPNPITLMPDAPSSVDTVSTDGHGGASVWAQVGSALVGHQLLLVAALAVSAVALWGISRQVRKFARGSKKSKALTNIAMVMGFGWSSEAVWQVTGRLHMGYELRIPLFAILELLLTIAMIRTEESLEKDGTPGRSGKTVWVISAGMSLIAAAASASLAEVLLRLIIPFFVTNTWWEGVASRVTKKTADGMDGPSTRRWTLRRFLLWIGAIEPGKNDIKTVHRERLTHQMTRLYYLKLHGWKKLSRRRDARLAKLTLVADDEILVEVMRRVRRTGWTKATLLVYSPERLVQRADAADEAALEGMSGGAAAQLDARRAATTNAAATRSAQPPGNRVTVPPRRRVKAASGTVTSGDAGGADPATLAAHLVLTQKIAIREAARQVPGAAEATVRRRVNDLRGAAGDAPSEPASTHDLMAPFSEPRPLVTHGVNGHPPTPEEI
jgi:hypothetical protein